MAPKSFDQSDAWVVRSWSPGNGLPGMTANYLAAMDAMYKVCPAAWTLASPAAASLQPCKLPMLPSCYFKRRWGVPGLCLALAPADKLLPLSRPRALQVNPDQLFMVEGLAQQGLAVCWGDGFSTDQSQLSRFSNTETATTFFKGLLNKPYLNNVIISVHYYGPSISTNWVTFSLHALSLHAFSQSASPG